MGALHLRARAKINLYLRVGEILGSGHHQITSFIQSVSLSDELVIEPADVLVCQCDDATIANSDNLVTRAASVLRERYNVRQGARISLRKRIPVGAGLGGGSADAAATLLGLARFWELDADPTTLVELAAGLGADVPFCLAGGTAIATGFGQFVEPLPALDLGVFLVAKPLASLATGRVYAEYDSLALKRTAGEEAMREAVESGDRERVIKLAANDLEPAAENLLPAIRELKDAALSAGAQGAMVSGSGSAVMVFPSAGLAVESLVDSLRDQEAELFVVECATKGTDIFYDH